VTTRDEIEAKVAELKRKVERVKREAHAIRKTHRSRIAQMNLPPMPNFEAMKLEHSDAYKGYMERVNPQRIGLTCPSCGAGDDGNRSGPKGNLRPWCIRCNQPLEDVSVKKRGWNIKPGDTSVILKKLRGLPDE